MRLTRNETATAAHNQFPIGRRDATPLSVAATLPGLFKSVEQAHGVGSGERLQPVRLASLDGVTRDRPLGAKKLRFPFSFRHAILYSSNWPTYMNTHILEMAWSLAGLGSHMYPGNAVTDRKYCG